MWVCIRVYKLRPNLISTRNSRGGAPQRKSYSVTSPQSQSGMVPMESSICMGWVSPTISVGSTELESISIVWVSSSLSISVVATENVEAMSASDSSSPEIHIGSANGNRGKESRKGSGCVTEGCCKSSGTAGIWAGTVAGNCTVGGDPGESSM